MIKLVFKLALGMTVAGAYTLAVMHGPHDFGLSKLPPSVITPVKVAIPTSEPYEVPTYTPTPVPVKITFPLKAQPTPMPMPTPWDASICLMGNYDPAHKPAGCQTAH